MSTKRAARAAAECVTSSFANAGKTNATYWPTGEVKTTTDAANRTVYATYDDLGRPVGMRATDASGPLLASWVYDHITTYGPINPGHTRLSGHPGAAQGTASISSRRTEA